MDLGYFGRSLLGSWPQAGIGVVLWSLSVSAGDWQTGEKLTRLCTIPEPATLTGTWDRTVGLRHGGANPAATVVVRIAGVSQRKYIKCSEIERNWSGGGRAQPAYLRSGS